MISIVLARLLVPEEFGIVGMVFVFTGFASVFVDFGFTSALIQNKESTTRDWSSVFWLNLGASIFLALLFSLCAPLLAAFYNQPKLESVAVAVSWTLVIRAFSLVQLTLLKKNIQFKEIAKIQLISQLVAGLVSITAAYKGLSYWSLIIQAYVSGSLQGIMLWFRTDWRPEFLFDSGAIRKMLDFTLPLIGMQTTHYWTHNMDNLIVGKMLGDSALGIYGRAYSLMLLPLQSISRVISSVMFPAYALIQDDPERIKRTYISINRMIALITFPMMFGVVMTAEPFVYVVLGEQWAGAIPIIRILAPLGAWRAVHSLSGNVFMASGKTSMLFKITLPSSILVAISMIVGLYINGLEGLALGYCSGSLVTGLLLDYYLKGLIGLSIQENFKSLVPMFIATIIMCAAVYLIDINLNAQDYLIRLVVCVLGGVAVYTGMALAFGLRQEVQDALIRKK